MPTLYEIAERYSMIDEALEASGGEITPETEAIVDGLLSELGLSESEKIDGYCALIAEKAAAAEAQGNEAARLSALSRSNANLVAMLKERLLWYFEIRHVSKLDTARFRLSVRTNGGARPVLITCRPEELPPEFQKLTIAPDNRKLREAIESGARLPFAELGERGKHLAIR